MPVIARAEYYFCVIYFLQVPVRFISDKLLVPRCSIAGNGEIQIWNKPLPQPTGAQPQLPLRQLHTLIQTPSRQGANPAGTCLRMPQNAQKPECCLIRLIIYSAGVLGLFSRRARLSAIFSAALTLTHISTHSVVTAPGNARFGGATRSITLSVVSLSSSPPSC